MHIIHSITSTIFKRHVSRIQSAVNDPVRAQEEVFKKLISGGENTEWGKNHDYKSVKNISDLKNRFPVQDYDTIKPYIDRLMQGEQNILWNEPIIWFAKSSGTTSDKSKFIPVSQNALKECHYQGGKDVIAMYLHLSLIHI